MRSSPPCVGATASLICGLSLAAACGPAPPATPAATASSTALASAAQDLGPSDTSQTVTVSLILKVQHADDLESFVQATQDPASPSYHQFLGVGEFAARYTPGQDVVRQIVRYLAGFAIQVTDTYGDQLVLKATGTVDAFNQAFSTQVHDYERNGTRFHKPNHPPQIPVLLQDTLVLVEGLSNEATLQSRLLRAPTAPAPAVLPKNSTASGVPGSYTVGDVANFFNINPLYRAGIDGAGRTVGIATLADFLPSDAYTYWSTIGLDVKPDRIRQVHVDGGAPLGAQYGTSETSLDVEQSGGIAPRADIVVYDAPNTAAGFLDLFYQAASDNVVDSLSASWGEAEAFYFNFNTVSGPFTSPEQVAFHQAFLELAAQGISTFNSAGDGGAYDLNQEIAGFANVLTVGAPASDPAITAAGGITTPITLNFGEGAPVAVVNADQVWGWDYLVPVYTYFGAGSPFPVGGGGGVSVFWPVPAYQQGTRGIRVSEPGQSLTELSSTGNTDLFDLPARFHGRNLPDVSLDADPYSGFILYSTPDGGLLSGYGGTSFVAPQLNGISALLSQASGGRVGLWNPMLYRFQRVYGYSPLSPLRDITAGDNWYYDGVPGYEPGAGLGSLDVTNLAFAVLADRIHF